MTDETYKVFHKDKNIEEYRKIKNIIHYCKKANYVFSLSNYDNIEQVITDANIVRWYGNEPSVRRAIKLLNSDNKIKEPIQVVMSQKCKKRLEDIEDMKKLTKIDFKVKRGIHKIVFE